MEAGGGGERAFLVVLCLDQSTVSIDNFMFFLLIYLDTI